MRLPTKFVVTLANVIYLTGLNRILHVEKLMAMIALNESNKVRTEKEQTKASSKLPVNPRT